MTVGELRAKHPFPWSYTVAGGRVIVADAKGNEVELFAMLDFVCGVTNVIQKKEAA